MKITKSQQKIAKATLKDINRPELSGVNINTEKNRLEATTGHVLAIREGIISEGCGDNTILSLLPTQKPTPQDVEEYNLSDTMAIATNNPTNSCGVISKKFPDVEPIINNLNRPLGKKEFKGTLKINASLLKTLSDALDVSKKDGVELTILFNESGKTTEAIKVTTRNKDSWGVIMPMRDI